MPFNSSTTIISTEEKEITPINTQHNLNQSKKQENSAISNPEKLKTQLANRTVENNIAHSSVNKLIRIIKGASLKEIQKLPVDCRTLLDTPRNVLYETCTPGLLLLMVSVSVFKIDEVFRKMFAVLLCNSYIFIPLCH